MPPIDPKEFVLLAPEIFLTLCGLVLLVWGSIGRGVSSRMAATFSILVTFVTTALVVWAQSQSPGTPILAKMFILDRFAFFWKIVFLAATILTILVSERFIEEGRYRAGEFYSLILLATTGMLFMASGFNLVSIWISLELMALSSYILAGYFKREKRSNEAAIKYFVLGALSSGILLYGISLLYGTTGTLHLEQLAGGLVNATANGNMLATVGWILVAIGFFFKIAAVPFHVWTPDVYVGAPTPVTAYLATASKAASFAVLMRVFFQGFGPLVLDWQIVVAAVAGLSMIWGNIAALTQKNVKRMLAYSSIAHAGYVLLGVLAANETGLWAAMFYMFAYSFFTLGAFGTVILLERKEYAGETYDDYAGLARRAPLLAAMMLVFMLALTGIPPTGGFFGKVYLFAAAIEAGWTWVAVIGVLTSAISLYYYMGIVVQMYLKESEETSAIPLRAPVLVAALGVCALVTVLLGLLPGPLVDLARSSVITASWNLF
ncbi:MAG: NADH-quinone oxidoreductase subunit N [Acidobacteriota bacterium]